MKVVPASILLGLVASLKAISVFGASNNGHVLVVGSINADLIVPVESLPELGETIVSTADNGGPEMEVVAGGKGANQAVSCTRLGAKVDLHCQLGNDHYSSILERTLTENEISTKHCKRHTDRGSGLGIVMLLPKTGEVSCVVVSGANSAWPAEEKLREDMRALFDVDNGGRSGGIGNGNGKPSCVMLQMEVPQYVNEVVAEVAFSHGIPVFQDIGGAERLISSSHFRHCTFISPNLTELLRLMKKTKKVRSSEDSPALSEANLTIEQVVSCARELQREEGARNVLVTLGSKGSVLVTESGETVLQDPIPIDCVVDETGAGDNYRAGFVVSRYVEGNTFQESMEFAAAAGAIAVSRMGAIPACSHRHEVLQLIEKHRHRKPSNSIGNNLKINGGYRRRKPSDDLIGSHLSLRGGQNTEKADDAEAGCLHPSIVLGSNQIGISGGDRKRESRDDSNPFPLKFASRLNSMKDRTDLWEGSNDVLGWIKRQGLVKGLDLVDFNYPQHIPAGSATGQKRDEIVRALDEAGLKCGAVCLRYPKEFQLGALTNPDPSLRNKAIQLTKEACQWALALGAEEVVVWSAFDGYDYSLQTDYDKLWKDVVEAFQEVCDCYPQVKISLEYKPTDENTRFFAVPSTGSAVVLSREVGRDNFGLTLDFGHCLMAGENPAQAVAFVGREAGGKLFGVQLGDGYGRLGAEDGLAFGSIHPTAALEFILWLIKIKFKGHIYFDTFPRNEDPVRECEYNIRRFKSMYRTAERLLAATDSHGKGVLEKYLRNHDAMGMLEFLEDAE